MGIKFYIPILMMVPLALWSFTPAKSAGESVLNMANTHKVIYQTSPNQLFKGEIVLDKVQVETVESSGLDEKQVVTTISKESAEILLEEFVNSH